jgi:hypothetical protein
VVVLGMESNGKATLLVAVTDDVADRVKAGDLVRELAAVVGGRGGGKATLAQAGRPGRGAARRGPGARRRSGGEAGNRRLRSTAPPGALP